MSTVKQHIDINEYESMLKNYAFSLTRNWEETEDLMHDTFYRAICNSDKFAEGTNVKAWLLTIMRNIFINNYRKRKRSFSRIEPLDNPAAANNIKKSAQNGSTRAVLAEDISKALSTVSTSFTEPFLMHYDGFHYDEIAEKKWDCH
jgi:RNA polymerase sigma-70 factor (ECF subfamily)